jgi:hypothetical protein
MDKQRRQTYNVNTASCQGKEKGTEIKRWP